MNPMDIIREGNDINVTWSVYGRNGLKYSLNNRVYHLWIANGSVKREITSFSIQSRNELVFAIDDEEVVKHGAYKLILQIKEPDSLVDDATYDLMHVFQVVSKTYPMRANKSIDGKCDIKIHSVLKNVYVSELEGASAYEIAVQNGFVGTQAQWLASLVGIQDIQQTASSSASGGLNIITFTLADGSEKNISIYNGAQGGAGSSALSQLSDVTLSSPSSGQVLTYNGSNWVNGNGTNYRYGRGINISGSNVISANFSEIADGLIALGYSLNGGEGGSASAATSLRALTDVYIVSPADGQVLTYDASISRWRPKTIEIPESGGGGGGSCPKSPERNHHGSLDFLCGHHIDEHPFRRYGGYPLGEQCISNTQDLFR